MSLTSLPGILQQQGAAAAPTFFGAYSMQREFWAEDPSWTNPGDGNDMVTWRDNGTVGSDLATGTAAGGNEPIYVDVGNANSKPAVRFTAASSTSGGYMGTASGTAGAGGTTVLVVGNVNDNDYIQYFIDSYLEAGDYLRVGAGPTTYTIFNKTDLGGTGGTTDTNPHLLVARFATDDAELWVDGASTIVDTLGDYDPPAGFTNPWR